ncbi:hypothetical protein K456DRAFT_403168 [Colletotrichum gloeosporioides 23]|nr:hypothetical protein K456DRAFT_403168 [Colletotrichum gloeosporioides 23]
MSRQGYRTAQWEGQPPPIEQRPWWNVRHPTAEKSPHSHDKDTPFQWMISSNHVVPGFDHPSKQENSPWYLLLRFMLMDLPHQIMHDISLQSWAEHPAPQNKAALQRPTDIAPYGKRHQRWGRRFLFSLPASCQSHESDGKWLVVAYLWGESKEWLETVDIGELIASLHCISFMKVA